MRAGADGGHQLVTRALERGTRPRVPLAGTGLTNWVNSSGLVTSAFAIASAWSSSAARAARSPAPDTPSPTVPS